MNPVHPILNSSNEVIKPWLTRPKSGYESWDIVAEHYSDYMGNTIFVVERSEPYETSRFNVVRAFMAGGTVQVSVDLDAAYASDLIAYLINERRP